MSPIHDRRPETAALVRLLGATAPGELLTYEQLNAVAGLDIRPHEHRHLLKQALKIAERDHKVSFVNERARGYRRLTAEQIHTVEPRAAAHQRRVARSTIKTLVRGMERADADRANISPETRRQISQGLARQGIIERVAATRAPKLDPASAGPPASVPDLAQQLLDRVRRRPVPKRLSG